MFGFLKKKEEKEPLKASDDLFAVANGELVAIDQVNDPVFSQKMMGDGYAVIPTDGEIHAPVVGQVLNIFNTKHAVGIKMANGLEILLHMGIDTVELKGAPFDVKVKEGQAVDGQTVIANVDLDALKVAEKSNDIIVVITNMDAVGEYTLAKTGSVTAGEVVGTATGKE